MRRSPDLNPRKLPAQARAKTTYAAIVQAAARILERDGYARLTTNRIAEVAGISIGSVYEFFPNKEAVVATLVTSTVEAVLADIESALEQALTQTPESGLTTWISAMFEAVGSRRALAAALLREVPFLYEVPAVRGLRRKLFGLAARGHVLGPSLSRHKRLEALTYLLPLMVSSAIVESVIRPPKSIARSDIQGALIDVLRPFLLAPLPDARERG